VGSCGVLKEKNIGKLVDKCKQKTAMQATKSAVINFQSAMCRPYSLNAPVLLA
jgi:hypothetical protein